jgi:hypothetical protein
MASDLEETWDALLAVTPPWLVRRPAERPPTSTTSGLLYAFDPSERAVVGVRSRECTAIASTEVGVVREMARCLRAIADGNPPK